MTNNTLEKYPVVSKNGIEYLAELDTFKNSDKELILTVTLFVKVKYKLLWMDREQFVEVHSSFYTENGLQDYVEAIKDTVDDYELKVKCENEIKKQQEEAKERNKKQLEEWDGVC